MITDLILSLLLFALSFGCCIGGIATFFIIIKYTKYPIPFLVSVFITFLCITLSELLYKYGNIKCTTSAMILFILLCLVSLISIAIAFASGSEGSSEEAAGVFIFASFMSYLFFLGGLKFSPDIRFENPDCDFQQTQQTTKTVEHKSSEETSLPVEQSEQVKQSPNKDILILDKENKNIYKLDENTSKQIIDLLNKQEQ